MFRAPKWVFRRLEALRRAFFWKGSANVAGGHCLVNWKTVCRSTREGGLGVLSLENMNIALLAKWWWRFLTDKNILWGPLIKGIYYGRRKPLREGSSFRPLSQWWRNVLSTRDIFRCGMSFTLGNGRDICFWLDIWAAQAPLRTLFPAIIDSVRGQTCRVRDCWRANRWKWGHILRGLTPGISHDSDQVNRLKETIISNPILPSKDVVHWRWSKSGEFSVKSLYLFLQNGGVSELRFKEIWKIKIPLKIKIFIWLVLRSKVNTKDNLLRRGWTGNDTCVLCLDNAETANHLFLGCHVTKGILYAALPDVAHLNHIPSAASLWKTACLRSGALRDKELVGIASVWWCIWLERNRRIFDNQEKSAGCLLKDAREFVCWWAQLAS